MVRASQKTRTGTGYRVYVGYAYDLAEEIHHRGHPWPPSPFFPSPWQGHPLVEHFFGEKGGEKGFPDAGAILIHNIGDYPIRIDALKVDNFAPEAQNTIFPNAANPLWEKKGLLPTSLSPGKVAIFTQYGPGTFDTSDNPAHPGP